MLEKVVKHTYGRHLGAKEFIFTGCAYELGGAPGTSGKALGTVFLRGGGEGGW